MDATDNELSAYEAEQKDKDLAKFCFDTILRPAEKHAKNYKENRKDNMKFFKGDQWRKDQPKYRAKATVNYLANNVKILVANICDNAPQFSITPLDDKGTVDTASILKKCMRHIFYINKMRLKTYKAVELSAIQGVSYFRPYWDPNMSDGEGDIRIDIEKADTIIRDPTGEDNFFIFAKDVSMADIARKWPDMVGKVKAIMKKGNEETLMKEADKGPSLPVVSTDGSMSVMYDESTLGITEQHERVELHAFWLRDDAVKKIAGKDENDQPIEENVPAFPHGRWIYWANRKVKLEDTECQTRHFAIAPLVIDPDPESDINGLSSIDFAKALQIEANESRALIKEWLTWFSRPRATVDPRSGIDPRKIKNVAGQFIPARPDQFRWDTANPISNDTFTYNRMSKDDIEYVTGMNDATMGRRPAGVIAAEAMKILTESGRTVIRPYSARLEDCFVDLMNIVLDLIQACYNVPRVIRIMGEDPIMINDPQMVEGKLQGILNDVSVGRYQVEVTPDSTLPRSDIERFERAMRLSSEGMADRQAVLEVSGLPNWRDIEDRLKKKEDEMKAKQAMPPPPPPPKDPVITVGFKDVMLAYNSPELGLKILEKAGIDIHGILPPSPGTPQAGPGEAGPVPPMGSSIGQPVPPVQPMAQPINPVPGIGQNGNIPHQP